MSFKNCSGDSIVHPELRIMIQNVRGFFVTSPELVVQSVNHAQLFVTPWTAVCQASLSFTIFWNLLRLMSVDLMVSSNHLILCHLLLLPLIFPNIKAFYNQLAPHIRWPKYWSFSFSFSPSDEYSEFISFRIEWFVPLSVQGMLKSLLQHHSSKA